MIGNLTILDKGLMVHYNAPDNLVLDYKDFKKKVSGEKGSVVDGMDVFSKFLKTRSDMEVSRVVEVGRTEFSEKSLWDGESKEDT